MKKQQAQRRWEQQVHMLNGALGKWLVNGSWKSEALGWGHVAGGPACTKATIPQEGEENSVRSEAWRDAGIAVKATPPSAHTTSHLGKLSREFQRGLKISHR